MRCLHRPFWIFTTLAMVAGVLTACTTGSPSARGFQPCVEASAFECTTVQVPVDWSDPHGEHIDLAVVRDPADNPAHKVGTLISIPGGPGTSGVDEILEGDKFSPELRSRFDIVSLDPRGVKRSHPIRCDAGLAQDRPNLIPDAGGQLTEVHTYAKDLAASCRQHTGPLLDHIDAVSVARDIEALRTELDVEQLTLYSRSYGTLSAQAYAELFPKRLRASVLDSVDDHSRSGEQFLTGSARAGEHTFAEFADWCARNTDCALHGDDPSGVYTDLYTAAAEGRLRDPQNVGEALRPLDLSQRTTAHLYGPNWPGLANDLRMLANNPLGPPSTPTRPSRSGAAVDFPAVAVCADWNFDTDDQTEWVRQWHDQNIAAPTLRAHFAWAAGSMCSGWPVEPANQPHDPRDTGSPSVLIINSRHDPATPHEWAVQVATRTPRAHLLTYDGWGHGVYDRTRCTIAATDRYLIELELPAKHSCPTH